MSIFDKYLVNSFLHTEDTGGALPTATWSEDFATDLGDFTTSGDQVWTRVTDEGNGDSFSARSGAITDRQTSILSLTKSTTQESTLLQFDYKTSTEAEFDYLFVLVDDVIVFRASGTNAWATKKVYVHGIGSHDIKFIYHRDSSSGSGTNQVWIDNVGLYNYNESAISNTETLFKKDVVFGSPTTTVKGELSVGRDIIVNKEIRAFNPSDGQISYRFTNTVSGNLFQQYQNGWKGTTLQTTDTDSYLRIHQQDTEIIKGQFGVSTSNPNGYLYMSDPLAKVRIGEALGLDLDKLLVVNGKSLFRDEIESTKLVTTGGSNSQFVKGDGTLDSSTYLTSFDITTQTDPKYLRSDISDSTSGNLTAKTFISNTLDNTTVASDNTRLSAYGLLGNRGAMYLTNSGTINIAAGNTVHGTETHLFINTDGKTGFGTTSPESRLDSVSMSTANNALNQTWRYGVGDAYRLKLKQGVSAGEVRWIFDLVNNSTEYTSVLALKRDKVGVGTIDPAYNLDVSGTGRFTSTVTATNFILSSDERLKKNILSYKVKPMSIQWKSFDWKETGENQIGVIAQELEKEHPEFVRTNSEGMKSVAYIDLLIAKIAELEARLEKIET